MEKNSSNQEAKAKREQKKVAELEVAQLAKSDANSLVVGIDLGDKSSVYCIRRRTDHTVILQGAVNTDAQSMLKTFEALPRQSMVVETGTHSRWVAQLLELLGHDVTVANARKLKLIAENNQKSDKVDAQLLSKLGCMSMDWLHPVYQRSQRCHSDLAVVRSRQALVDTRTALINYIRGTVKSFGARLRACGAEAFLEVATAETPASLKAAHSGVFAILEQLNEEIHRYDCEIRHLCETKYRESTMRLLEVRGIGPLTSLTFVLTIEDKHRFVKSRDVGAYLGLVPKKRQSGERDPQLGITKTGDELLRKLLVNCAHYMLGAMGEDSDLRRWGLEIVRKAQSHGKAGARKLAAAAVARKLAVLMHRLWVTGARYEPVRNSVQKQAA